MGVFKYLFGGKAKKQEEETTSLTQDEPWGPAADAVKQYLPMLMSVFAGTPMVGGTEQMGIDMLTKAAQSGEADLAPAIAENNKTISGDYLTVDSNPYLQDIATRVSGIAGSNAAGTFGGRGRTTGGLSGYYHGKAVGDSLTDLYGSNYQFERGQQGQAVGMAPSLYGAKLAAPAALTEIGSSLSNRPLERAALQGGILSQIAGLGGTRQTDASGTVWGRKNGLVGDIFNALTNKAFGTTRSTGG